MAGPVKTVCFIASAIIAWDLFVIGEAIASFDYKITGNENPYFPPIGLSIINHLSSIVIHGLLLHGIRKESTRFMFPWRFLYYTFVIVGWLPFAMIDCRLIVNYFWPNHFEVSREEFNWFSLYMAVYVCGELVEEIYKSIKKIEDGKKTKMGENNTMFEKDPGMTV